MKKQIAKLLLYVAFISIENTINAQSLFVKINSGYNFGMTSFTDYNLTENGINSFTYERVDISYGKGVNLDFEIGYTFNKYLGTSIVFSQLIGGNTTREENLTSAIITYNYSSSMTRFIPCLILTPGYDKLNPYFKLGLIVGSGQYTIMDESKNISGSNNQYKKSTKFDGGIAFGLFNSFGITYKLNKKLLISSELFMNSLSYAPSKSELIEYYVNGKNKLNTRSLYERQTEYSDNFTAGLINYSQLKKDIKRNIPFSSIGFNIGLVYSF